MAVLWGRTYGQARCCLTCCQHTIDPINSHILWLLGLHEAEHEQRTILAWLELYGQLLAKSSPNLASFTLATGPL